MSKNEEAEVKFTPGAYMQSMVSFLARGEDTGFTVPEDMEDTELARMVARHKTGAGRIGGLGVAETFGEVISRFGKEAAFKDLSEADQEFVITILSQFAKKEGKYIEKAIEHELKFDSL